MSCHVMHVASRRTPHRLPACLPRGLLVHAHVHAVYLANPDLHKRLALGAQLNEYDRNTFYSQGMEGYLDYPTLA